MSAAPDVGALEALTEAVESGAGLPEVVRAAARAIDASLVVLDRAGQVLAVAARSPAEEQAILTEGEEHPLRVAGEEVGTLRLRPRSVEPGELTPLVRALLGAEVQRARAPQQASAEAAGTY